MNSNVHIAIINFLINNKLNTSPNDIYTRKSGNRKEKANKIEYTYIEQTYTTNITEEKETKKYKAGLSNFHNNFIRGRK